MNDVTDNVRNEHLHAELAEHIFDVEAILQQRGGRVFKELDLTGALAGALWSFDPDGGPISRRDLAARLRCDPSNVTFLADRLEARGYIERSIDRRDRRYKAMRLTPEGAAARARLLAGFASQSPFARLTAVERRLLADLLARCVGEQTGPSLGEASDRDHVAGDGG